ncbi:MAG: glycosyltransferase [Candidatus Hydrogenedentota bacterium]|nr:MAG: glycosyltransferase [Candidatus Hydrogenedentota bacterium]
MESESLLTFKTDYGGRELVFQYNETTLEQHFRLRLREGRRDPSRPLVVIGSLPPVWIERLERMAAAREVVVIEMEEPDLTKDKGRARSPITFLSLRTPRDLGSISTHLWKISRAGLPEFVTAPSFFPMVARSETEIAKIFHKDILRFLGRTLDGKYLGCGFKGTFLLEHAPDYFRLLSLSPIERFYFDESAEKRGLAAVKKARLSIVVLTYQNRRLVQRTVESLFETLTWPRREIIVVDNASTDDTKAVLRRYEASRPDFRYLRLERNRGPAGGREAGRQAARGDFLVFLDNDTVMMTPGWDRTILSILGAFPKIGLLCSFATVFTSDDRPGTFLQNIYVPRYAVPAAIGSGFFMAARASVLDKIGGFHPELFPLYGSEDVSLSYALRAEGYATVASPVLLPLQIENEINPRGYDYDRSQTAQRQREIFRCLWGDRYRLLDPTTSNRTSRGWWDWRRQCYTETSPPDNPYRHSEEFLQRISSLS